MFAILPLLASGQYTSHLLPALFPEGEYDFLCYVEPSLEAARGPYGMCVVHRDTSYFLITKEVVDWHRTVLTAVGKFPFKHENGLDEKGRQKEKAYNKRVEELQKKDILQSVRIKEDTVEVNAVFANTILQAYDALTRRSMLRECNEFDGSSYTIRIRQ